MAPVAAFSYSRFWSLLDVDDDASGSNTGHDSASVDLASAGDNGVETETVRGTGASKSATVSRSVRPASAHQSVASPVSQSAAATGDDETRDGAVELLHVLSMAADGSIGVRIVRVGVAHWQ